MFKQSLLNVIMSSVGYIFILYCSYPQTSIQWPLYVASIFLASLGLAFSTVSLSFLYINKVTPVLTAEDQRLRYMKFQFKRWYMVNPVILEVSEEISLPKLL